MDINRFLTAFASGSTVSEAARFAGCSTGAIYKRKATDADFAEAYAQAKEASADTLEAEARRRAVDGVDELVIHQGQRTPIFELDERGEPMLRSVEHEWIDTKTGEPRSAMISKPVQARNPDGSLQWLTVNKRSDPLLALLLKGRRMDVFGTERKELTGAEGKPLMDSSTREARIMQLMALAEARKAADSDEPLA